MPVNILIADDDTSILRLYSRLFSGKGYSISTAETFAEASSLLRGNDYDLLITDFTFPDGLGTELIKIFNEAKAGARSILVTGAPDAAKKLAREGVLNYIEKPFQVEKFMEAVTKALG